MNTESQSLCITNTKGGDVILVYLLFHRFWFKTKCTSLYGDLAFFPPTIPVSKVLHLTRK
uniref:Uncharacterized protein n=1 Tax=Anguilla anguilla TaxID=7936 RepID=A0A0E9QNT2_ANGAN